MSSSSSNNTTTSSQRVNDLRSQLDPLNTRVPSERERERNGNLIRPRLVPNPTGPNPKVVVVETPAAQRELRRWGSMVFPDGKR